ncbi:MAG: hypothetical protein KGH54_00685 [Candidatus Micrarchaeota archaeon]|nr:hypothetical protein [Candidatus Micrarchaeota archaeon]
MVNKGLVEKGFAEFSIPVKFYGARLSDAERESVCAKLSEGEKAALKLFWIGQGFVDLKNIRKNMKPTLSKELELTLESLEKKKLIYLAEDLNHPGETYVMVMPQGFQVMGLLFSKRD